METEAVAPARPRPPRLGEEPRKPDPAVGDDSFAGEAALGLIIQGSHPVGWCPRDQNPVSQHDTLGDIEPNFIEYTLVKFHLDDTYVLPVATLRPETVYGVTNLWVNPHVKYVVARVGKDNEPMWIISRDAVKKLEHQGHKADIDHEIDGMELVGKYVSNPITQSRLPIYPASFVDPKDGSGLVMSVPVMLLMIIRHY